METHKLPLEMELKEVFRLITAKQAEHRKAPDGKYALYYGDFTYRSVRDENGSILKYVFIDLNEKSSADTQILPSVGVFE